MVNADRVKRKLPSLHCDGETGKRSHKNNDKFMRYRYRLEQFKKRNPERFNTLLNRLIVTLKEIEQEIKKNEVE
jgi:hypothetical protein